jgi:cobalamin-dependent methionine synthase I
MIKAVADRLAEAFTELELVVVKCLRTITPKLGA